MITGSGNSFNDSVTSEAADHLATSFGPNGFYFNSVEWGRFAVLVAVLVGRVEVAEISSVRPGQEVPVVRGRRPRLSRGWKLRPIEVRLTTLTPLRATRP